MKVLSKTAIAYSSDGTEQIRGLQVIDNGDVIQIGPVDHKKSELEIRFDRVIDRKAGWSVVFSNMDEIILQEFCGWTRHCGTASYDGYQIPSTVYKKDGVIHNGCPNYIRSLDAIHEVECCLSDNQFKAYELLLLIATGFAFNFGAVVLPPPGGLRSIISATIAQRVKALVQTLTSCIN